VFKKITSDYDITNHYFYDIGAGKGKILILANEYLKCRAYYGIECNEELASIARSNLQKTGAQGIIVQGRAEQFTDYAEQCIVYLCDPFGEDTLRAILTQIKQKARTVILAYNNPVYPVDSYGFVRVAETTGWHANYQTGIFIYTAKV
jgi:predicted RNA methylase